MSRVVALVWAAGCGGGDSTMMDADVAAHADAAVAGCVPGSQIDCACTNGQAGMQVCRSDRTYEFCVCDTPKPCTPDADVVLDCTCSDGQAGHQLCLPSGRTGICDCGQFRGQNGPGGPGDASFVFPG